MLRKISLFFIFIFIVSNAIAQRNIEIKPTAFDFGIVAKWKNDTAFFEVTNKTSGNFIFLPLGYTEDVMVIAPHSHIQSGETAIVKVVYFTHSRGNFRKEIPLYVNINPDPVKLVIKGKIIDFHPDAMMNCPTLGGEKPVVAESNVEIEVKDAVSGKSLSGFNMILKNNLESRLIEISQYSKVKFDKVRNGKFKVTVSLEGYETKEEEIFVSKSSRKFIIKLYPDEEPLISKKEQDNKDEKDEIIIEKEKSDDKEDIEKLRKKYDDLYKDKKIIEKDVILVKEKDKDSVNIDTSTYTPDFDNSGKLNIDKYANNNIVFLIDVSGSMEKPNKLPLLKKAVIEMVKVLRQNDLVTIITYAGKVKILLEGESGENKEKIYEIINNLEAKGQSYGSEGMKIAYENAIKNYIKNGNNQVILVSDGLFNSDDFSPKKIYKLTKEYAQNYKIITSAIGFGKNEEAIDFLKNVAKNGMGNFIVITTLSQANTALINEVMQNSLKK